MDSLCLSSNLVNTCFANTTLQTILHLPFLQGYINKHKECSKYCYCQQYHNGYKCTLSYIILYMFNKIIEDSLHVGGAKVIQPTEIYNNQLNSD